MQSMPVAEARAKRQVKVARFNNYTQRIPSGAMPGIRRIQNAAVRSVAPLHFLSFMASIIIVNSYVRLLVWLLLILIVVLLLACSAINSCMFPYTHMVLFLAPLVPWFPFSTATGIYRQIYICMCYRVPLNYRMHSHEFTISLNS